MGGLSLRERNLRVRINRWKSLAMVVGVVPTALMLQVPASAAVEQDDRAPAVVQDYYEDAKGKTGEELKSALHGIISTNDQLSYDDVWEALKVTDQDPQNENNVMLFYSGRSDSKDNNGGGEGNWNREHVWAKSHGDFGTSIGPGTDIHHLRPTDAKVNSTRGNKDFDMGGEEVEGAPGNFTDEDSWEPRNEVKGDVARMIMYMAVRYEGNEYVDLELNDEVNNGEKPLFGRQSELLRWHNEDPVDEFEKNRNQVIFDQFQNNRNPFIDHPEWAGEIWK